MPEPIAVAFVEVRPNVDDFKSTAERDIQESIGPVDVRGQVRLEGLQEAKADVSALTGDLQGISGTQLQFPGLEDARLNAEGLGVAMKEATGVSVQGTFQPLLDDVSRLRGEAEALSASLSGLPTNIALDQGDIGSTIDQTAALDEAQGSLGDTLGTSATAASALIAKYPQLAAGEQALAAATLEGGAAARAAAVEEEKLGLVRTRARRASSLGPLRLAGVGLAAGVGLFAATRAIGDLSERLRVTGNEASTTGGKLRNAFSAALTGDISGVFTSLANTSHDFSVEELKLINQTPQLERALTDMGKGAELTKSRLEALSQVVANPVPQFIDTAIARAQATGDVGAERRALDRAETAIKDAQVRARQLQPQQRALQDEIRDIQVRRQEILDEIERGKSQGREPSFEQQALVVGLDDEIKSLTDQKNAVQGPLNAAQEALLVALKRNRDREKALEQEAAERRIGGLRQRFGDRALAAELSGARAAQLAALQEEATQLRGIVADRAKVGLATWREAATALKSVNQDIEGLAASFVAENTRHVEAMTSGFALSQAREAAVGTDTGLTRSLQAEKLTIQATIPQLRVLVALKQVDKSALTDAYNRIAAIDSQIESIQAAHTAETERHANAMSDATKRAADKLAEADQAFLRSIDRREGAVRNKLIGAEARAGLGEEIKLSNELQAIYKESIAQARKRIADKQLQADTIAGLTTKLLTEQTNEAALRVRQPAERVALREEALDLQIELAGTTGNRQKEIAGHRAKIAFLRERIDHTRRQSLERLKLRVAIAKERAAIRDLLKENETDEGPGSATTLADLFTKQTELGRQRSFDQQMLAPKVGDLTQPIENQVTAKLKAQADVSIKSPFDRSDRIVTSQEKLRESIERLTATIPNLTGSTLGGPAAPAAGVVEGMRYEAAARFWQSRRGKQLAQETASA